MGIGETGGESGRLGVGGAIRPSAVPLPVGCRRVGVLSNESRLKAERIKETRPLFDGAVAKPSGDPGGGSTENGTVNNCGNVREHGVRLPADMIGRVLSLALRLRNRNKGESHTHRPKNTLISVKPRACGAAPICVLSPPASLVNREK